MLTTVVIDGVRCSAIVVDVIPNRFEAIVFSPSRAAQNPMVLRDWFDGTPGPSPGIVEAMALPTPLDETEVLSQPTAPAEADGPHPPMADGAR